MPTILNIIQTLLLLAHTHFVLPSPLPLPTPQDQEPPTTSCPAITIISVRGATEYPGEGRLGTLAGDIGNASENTQRIALDYPAELFPYYSSVLSGIRTLTDLLNGSSAACPDTKFVLMGYSEGAHVIGDTLCGGLLTREIDSVIGGKVAAIIFMADPRHVANEPINVGTASRNGLFPRPSFNSCSNYYSRMKSYCDAGDWVCDSGLNRDVHSAVVEKYRAVAVAFVNGLL
ncbi:hypothetical protein AJ79_04806 [Helicocarpus griseus UAMH5409]|uniref:Cutinase n=1 Tax=Helicocarpus griseus UAMH5409 TaxID=1447875 RepID=A0A2B7XSH2_9EURO|nr:hypothetical protein AJ79_04806 [Helicocarpus griseus UAMH5409]